MTDGKVKDSDVSNTVKVTCPSLPPNVSLNQQPSYKKGTVTVAWDRPPGSESAPFGEEILYYRYCGRWMVLLLIPYVWGVRGTVVACWTAG